MAKVKVVIESDEDIKVKVTAKDEGIEKLIKDIQNADGVETNGDEN